jgi:hypothetical protein
MRTYILTFLIATSPLLSFGNTYEISFEESVSCEQITKEKLRKFCEDMERSIKSLEDFARDNACIKENNFGYVASYLEQVIRNRILSLVKEDTETMPLFLPIEFKPIDVPKEIYPQVVNYIARIAKLYSEHNMHCPYCLGVASQ